MEKLVQGRQYQIRDSTTGMKLFHSPATYVMPQEYKLTNLGIWETFFSELNEECLYRLRIPQKSITKIADDFVLTESKLVKTIVWKDPVLAYTPMVETWLKEVEKIERGMR